MDPQGQPGSGRSGPPRTTVSPERAPRTPRWKRKEGGSHRVRSPLPLARLAKDGLVLELVGEAIERRPVEARSQLGIMGNDAVDGLLLLRAGPRQSSSQGLVHDLLHRLAAAMHLSLDETCDIGVEREGSAH